MAKNLDTKDWKILELLCENARLSHNQIARKVGLSKNTVTYRIERLKKRGVIDGFFTVIDHETLGDSFYDVLFKINATKDKEKEFTEFLSSHPNVLVADRHSGEWNFVIELGCKSFHEFLRVVEEINSKFSEIIDTYEAHPILDSYKVEQLPVELVKEKEYAAFKIPDTIEHKDIDSVDKKILFELDQDCTKSLRELSSKVGVSSETVAQRIKIMKKNGIILRFTAKIDVAALGYEMYHVIIELHNLSREKSKQLRNYFIAHKRIRYAFMSAIRPAVFAYFAAKNADELDQFLLETKERFRDVVIDQKYTLARNTFKYQLFPAAFLK